MLAVSPLSSLKNEREGEMEGYSMQTNEFGDFSIDFDELFVGISDGDVLPYLEMDSEIFAEFSASAGDESMPEMLEPESNGSKRDDVKLAASSGLGSGSGSGSGSISSGLVHGDEIVSKRDEHVATKESGDKARKSTASSKNLNGKRKVKVDWTPELHRRFVQAVEQLGVDKAVPSRILELMGVDCLTRHNVASHLQKYRSHRKHLLAREAEAATWSQRRQMYGTVAGGGKKDHVNPWIAPTLVGFPPVTHMTQFRPLHVWGHPSVDQSRMHMWPKHLTHPPPQIHAWPPAQTHHHPPPADHSFWISPHHVPTPGTPFFPPHLQPTMYPAPPVPGIPPPVMYKADMAGHGGMPPQPGQALPRPPSDVHPSKESVDAAIGDVLSKPWLPLPLGLKPPSVDGVVVELQRQGISKIPPTCASNFEQAAVMGR